MRAAVVGVRTPPTHTCALYSDNDVFSDPSSKLQGEPDEPFNSRCQMPPTTQRAEAETSFAFRDRPFFAKGFEGFALGLSCEARGAKQDGGARRDRTDDLMLAKHALYQLSYGP